MTLFVVNERREFNFQCTEWRGKGVFLLLIVLTVFGLLCSMLPFPKMSTNALIVPNTDINEQMINKPNIIHLDLYRVINFKQSVQNMTVWYTT